MASCGIRVLIHAWILDLGNLWLQRCLEASTLCLAAKICLGKGQSGKRAM